MTHRKKQTKIYGVFIEYKGSIRGYVGPRADALSAKCEIVSTCSGGKFSTQNVKVFREYDEAKRKANQLKERGLVRVFVSRISKHNNYITMQPKSRTARCSTTKQLLHVQFLVHKENRQYDPYKTYNND